MINRDLAKIFQEWAAILDMQEIPFKPRAYERAAFSIQESEESVEEIYKKSGLKALEGIPGVGASIAEKIEEFIKTGHIKEFEKLKEKFPMDITGLMRVEGLGPKAIYKLYEELHIKNIAGLEAAAKHGRIRNLPGFGEKSEEKILKHIGFLEKSNGRFLLSRVLPLARKFSEKIRKIKGVKKVEYAGSLRRMQETIGDLDLLVISTAPEKVMEYFASLPEVEEVIARGETKTSVRLDIGMNADVRVLPPESFGAAWQYFTGDKYHNVSLREIAIKKGYKLNEYGLFKGEKIIAAENEEDIYKALDMEWIPPEIRNNNGEIEAAIENKLPRLVEYGDLRGDLQVQTDWSDGENSIKEMAETAKKSGLKYVLITDHTKSLGVAGGLNEKEIGKQMEEIDRVQKEISGIKILKGAEVNILKDGTLDIADETLAKLDIVGIAVHSLFSMTEKDMTARVIRAMENPNADILFHPTGRIIQKREPYKIDMDAIIETAKKTKTVLEIDAYPDRLDLKDEHIRKAVAYGVKLSIDSDTHDGKHFNVLEYGIGQARRGWAEKKDIVNAHDWKEMLKMLKSN